MTAVRCQVRGGSRLLCLADGNAPPQPWPPSPSEFEVLQYADCLFCNSTYLDGERRVLSFGSEQIRADGRMVDITAGMNATVEIKIGQRQIIEFLLAPLLRYRGESLRER